VNITAPSGSTKIGAWNHIAATRSGDEHRLFVNGALVANTTVSGSLVNTGRNTQIGYYVQSGGTFYSFMYASDFRIVNGTALYTAAFTPPTAPLTAIANTSLLCNFTNAGIYDAAMANDLETIGNAQVSTAQSKWGGGSMYFDGTGDYLIMNGGENFAFGTGDFTIEFWYYSNNTGVQHVVYDPRPSSTNGAYMAVYKQSGDVFAIYVSGAARITGTTLISAGTWYHIAVCRSGTSTKLFVNGVQDGSTYTDSTNYLNPANRPIIGADGFTLGATPVNGYISDLRILKGVAILPTSLQTSQWQDQ
jgi:hypothetical protein